MSSKKGNKPTVHEEMKGLELYIDEFGEIKMSKSPEELNKFLNKHVEDKKLKSAESGKKDKK